MNKKNYHPVLFCFFTHSTQKKHQRIVRIRIVELISFTLRSVQMYRDFKNGDLPYLQPSDKRYSKYFTFSIPSFSIARNSE